MKLILIGLIILIGIIIGLIDKGGALLYMVVLAYLGISLYAIEKIPLVKRVYDQLPGFDSYKFGHILSLFAVPTMIFFGVFIVPEDVTFSDSRFLLITGLVFTGYLLVVFLPALIRAKK